MLDFIYNFIASDWWDTVAMLATAWGVLSLVALMCGYARSLGSRIAVWTGIGAMVAVVIFSMVFEEFLPRLHNMGISEAVTTAIGMAGIFLSVAFFAFGGFVFVRDTLGRIGAVTRPGFGRKGSKAGAETIERVPARAWLGVWGPGLLRMGIAVLLLVLSASLYHPDRFPIPWFWAPFGL
jgi:hypothetical protein